jgi:hypothetical protein
MQFHATPFPLYDHKSGNNGSRKTTDSIVIRLDIVTPEDHCFTLIRGKGLSLARYMQIEYRVHSTYYPMCARTKEAGVWNWPRTIIYLQDEGQAGYNIARCRSSQFVHSHAANERDVSYVIRGYINDSQQCVCVILDLQITLHSAASWIYHVPVLLITLININQ